MGLASSPNPRGFSGTARAVEHGQPGAVYFLTDGPPTTHREFFTRYLATGGRAAGTRSLPAGVVADRMWRLLRPRSRPPLRREAAATLAATITVSSGQAHEDLGYSPINRETAMAALAERSPE